MAAAASSSCDLHCKNDVFINFRGKDTRKGFVSHLLKRLRQKPINTYIDAENLRKGDRLYNLLAAIQVSRLSIVVLSQNYASSPWCLKELVQILRCKDTKSQIVLPIFFAVDPSYIRNLEGSFAEAFAKHECSVHVEEVQRWKAALVEVTSLSGFNLKQYKDEAELVEKIVEDVSEKLNYISSTSSKGNGLVEMDSHMHEMHLLLYATGVEANDVRVVGIWGMGGLGKTTIARAVYNEICDQFEACCFLENVKEHGKLRMQKQLLYSILGNKVRSADISNKGFEAMLESIGQRKVLIVVDDVDELSQIEALIGKQHSFGGGSRIIITSRDKQLLSKADDVYEPKLLSDPGALQLFRRLAFKTNEPHKDFDDLSQSVIQYAKGLPLALKDMGDFLVNKTVHEWKDELEKRRKILKKKIHEVLKTSFDGLDADEKDIFLDIACFFKGMKVDYVTEILKCCGFHPCTGLSVLRNRALITVSQWGDLDMHYLLQQMGQNIVREQSIKEPGGRTRLWSYEDVHRVLTENTATDAVESIILDLQKSDELCLNVEAFVPMTRLRLLKIYHAGGKLLLTRNLKFLSGELRCLSWIGFPLRSLPSNFLFKNLVDLDMQHSLIDRLWEGNQILEKLKFINLSHCQLLKETPDFTKAPNLEKLILQSCMSLMEVHPSISTLTNLVLLNLNGCGELKSLPSIICMKSLETLDLSGCPSLENIPEILEVKKKLSKLNLSRIKY